MSTMMMASLRRLAVNSMMMARGGAVRLDIHVKPRSTTTVEGADIGLGENDHGRQQVGYEDGGTASTCPFNLPVSESTSEAPAAEFESSVNVRPMNELSGPIGWPIIGNFLTYLKKENQGKMHEVQVSTTL